MWDLKNRVRARGERKNETIDFLFVCGVPCQANSSQIDNKYDVNDKDKLKPDTTIRNHYTGSQSHQPRFVLGYWSTRCLGAPIRMLLHAGQVDHWMVMYDVKEDESTTTGWDKSSWYNDKEWLNLDYPLINLPFLVDCAHNKILSQTNAILAYLGRELDMMGTTKWETCKCKELLNEITDLRDLYLDFAYEENQDTLRHDALIMLGKAGLCFAKLENHLRKEYSLGGAIGLPLESPCYLVGVGNRISAPDFCLWDILDQFQGLYEHLGLSSFLKEGRMENSENHDVKTFPYLRRFCQNLIYLPANSTYGAKYRMNEKETRDPVKLPYNNPYARFGSDPESLGKYVRDQKKPWKGRGVSCDSYDTVSSVV
eukprot:scaffold15695_cov160-Amphora_coffeaeformis.AAC.4